MCSLFQQPAELQKSTELLTRLVEDVTLDPFSDDVSFRLGGRALDALLEIFTYNDFAVRDGAYMTFASLDHPVNVILMLVLAPTPNPVTRSKRHMWFLFVRRFLAGYKFCLLEHFRRSPLPSLLCTQERIPCSSVSILLHFCRLSLPSLSKSAKMAKRPNQ